MSTTLKIRPLPQQLRNFQLGYIPDSLREQVKEESVGKSTEKYIGVPLQSRKRRVILRCSLLAPPQDVLDELYCDLRVQQLFPAAPVGDVGDEGNLERKTGIGKERKLLSVSEPHHHLHPPSSVNAVEELEMEDGNKGTEESWRRKGEELWVGRGRNDYSEIDLAHHVAEIEDGGGGVTTTRSGLAVAEKNFLFDELPPTVRFNDALVCTSKDIQILKSGTIKMMRLTVICHSDLHYQNHTQKHRRHHQTHKHSQNVESCFSNETTAKKTVSFGKTSSFCSSTTSTSPSSSVQVSENVVDVDDMAHEKNKRTTMASTITTQVGFEEGKTENISKCMPSHQHSNHDEHHFISTVGKREEEKESKTVKSTSLPTTPSSSASKDWKRLGEKIRNIFQTYDIHVAGSTIVDLNGCPLASFQAKFSPAIRFVFVEECEMKTNLGTELGKVSGKTEIIISNVHHISYYQRLLMKHSGQKLHLYGLESAAKLLHSLIEIQERELLPKQRDDSSVVGLTEFSHGFLISGPSGCGKVFVVRETAKKVGAHLLCFNPVGASGSSSGFVEHVSHFCQQLSEIFMSALVTASRYPTVLLLPRIHLLFQSSSGNSPSSAKSFGFSSSKSGRERVLHHLCKLFDSIPEGLALSVVGTTDKAFLVPLQLRRAGRLEKEIIISPPKESERLKILQEISKDLPQFTTVDLSLIASQTPGYVGQDLLKLLRLALFKCEEENCSQVEEHHVKYSLGRVLPSVLQGALGVVDIQRAISLDHIAGLHSVKLDLIKAIVWPLNHPHAFLRMGISPPKGILLYGPPGNCKTTLVRAVAASHQTNFLSVSAAELFSSGVGDSEKIVAHLFHRARMASPCILFIDELESIVGSRQNSEKKQTSTNESILSMLLTEMDGVGVEKIQDASAKGLTSTPNFGPLVLVVAATNRPDLIDPALLRPGRFDKLIPVPPLDINGRKELLEFCSKSIPFHADVDFVEVAKVTEFYSGADLVNLCKEAALFALSEDMSAPFVRMEHVCMGKRVVSPSLNPVMLRSFHEYGSKRSCC